MMRLGGERQSPPTPAASQLGMRRPPGAQAQAQAQAQRQCCTASFSPRTRPKTSSQIWEFQDHHRLLHLGTWKPTGTDTDTAVILGVHHSITRSDKSSLTRYRGPYPWGDDDSPGVLGPSLQRPSLSTVDCAPYSGHGQVTGSQPTSCRLDRATTISPNREPC